MGNIPVEQLYSIAMDQYAKGINQLIPHAVWYNDSDVTFLPELSWRNPLYSDALPQFNKFLSRLNYLLRRPGRTVANIAMLYPIQTLQAGHYLDGPEGFYAGGFRIPDTDYIDVDINSYRFDKPRFHFSASRSLRTMYCRQRDAAYEQ